MLYNPPFDGQPNDPYINCDPSLGHPGSLVPAAAVEYPQRELVNAITTNGGAPTNADLYQLSRAIQLDLVNFAIDTGTLNHLVVTLPVTPTSPLVAGLKIFVLVKFNNTVGVDIYVNGLGPYAVLTPLLEQLGPDAIATNGIALVYYDGTRFQLLFGAKASAGPTGPQGAPGTAGAKGDTGAAGANGANGAQGPKGADGTTYPLVKGGIGTYALGGGWDGSPQDDGFTKYGGSWMCVSGTQVSVTTTWTAGTVANGTTWGPFLFLRVA